MDRQSSMVWLLGPHVPGAGGAPGPRGSRGSVHAGTTEDAALVEGGSVTAARTTRARTARAPTREDPRRVSPETRGANAVDVIEAEDMSRATERAALLREFLLSRGADAGVALFH